MINKKCLIFLIYQATLDAMKLDPLITAFFYVVRVVNGIFPAVISKKLFYTPGITMACSNVPGEITS